MLGELGSGHRRGKGRIMRKVVIPLLALAATLIATATAGAADSGRFIGTPSCTGNDAGFVSCDARVAGLRPHDGNALLFFQTEWHCTAIPSIEVLADNALSAGAPVSNGREFTVWNTARYPTFYEVIFQTDFGCPGDAWTATRYTSAVISLNYPDGPTYSIGTIEPEG
jgi:hypothetical protein